MTPTPIHCFHCGDFTPRHDEDFECPVCGTDYGHCTGLGPNYEEYDDDGKPPLRDESDDAPRWTVYVPKEH